MPGVVAGVVGFVLWAGSESAAQAQMQPPPAPIPNLNRFYYYPYYYFPHNYWPTQGPKWPEPVGAPYMRPPAYMAYPPYLEPGWRYDLFEAHKYYRGFHFWLDQF
jgi:hypothetical protein